MQEKKPILFSMARLDKVKNLTGLVSWFANNEKLQKLVNLVLVGGIVDPSQSSDREEKAQCEEVGIPPKLSLTDSSSCLCLTC